MKLDLSDTRGVRLLTAVAEAERCYAIAANVHASVRPEATWAILPFGESVTASLMTLVELPMQPDDTLNEKQLATLTARLEHARAAWHAYVAQMERPINVH